MSFLQVNYPASWCFPGNLQKSTEQCPSLSTVYRKSEGNKKQGLSCGCVPQAEVELPVVITGFNQVSEKHTKILEELQGLTTLHHEKVTAPSLCCSYHAIRKTNVFKRINNDFLPGCTGDHKGNWNLARDCSQQPFLPDSHTVPVAHSLELSALIGFICPASRIPWCLAEKQLEKKQITSSYCWCLMLQDAPEGEAERGLIWKTLHKMNRECSCLIA